MSTGVSTAYAMIDGKKVIAVYDSNLDVWVVEANAPAISSWPQPDHVYTISLYAEDEAGNTTTMTASDPVYGDQLKIRVLEKSAPIATILTPTAMSVFGSNSITVSLAMEDVGDSGINLSSVAFVLNGVERASELSWTNTGGVYSAIYSANNLNDGINSISFSVMDNDGNESEEASVTFIVSTVAPTLEITSPAEGIITNSETVLVSGSSSIVTSGVVITSITVNGTEIPILENNSFSYEYSLVEGENLITIVSTDSAGNSTQVLRHVVRDTLAPIITDVSAESTVVDASGMIRVTFRVVDPS